MSTDDLPSGLLVGTRDVITRVLCFKDDPFGIGDSGHLADLSRQGALTQLVDHLGIVVVETAQASRVGFL